ncbi:MAG: HAMP domain-containing protein [Betaproteobacteria bacterium]|nr:HAMP domain-containing protein [Betaproteobacteria bacterium]
MKHLAKRFGVHRVAGRLTLGFTCIVAITLAMILLAAHNLQRISGLNAEIVLQGEKARTAQSWNALVRNNLDRAMIATRLDAAAGGDQAVQGRLAPAVGAINESIGASQGPVADLQKQLDAMAADERERSLADAVRSHREAFVKLRAVIRDDILMGEPAARLDAELVPKAAAMLKALDDLVGYIEQRSRESSQALDAVVREAIAWLLGLGLLAIAACVVIARLTIRSITKPVAEAVAMAEGVALGDLNRSSRHAAADEFGQLIDAMRSMQSRLRDFVGEQERLATSHGAGEVSVRMDAERFPGAFGDMGAKLNALVDGHVSVQQEVLEIIGQYAKGDFRADLPALPGERAAVKAALDAVKSNLQGVNTDLMRLVAAAGRGEFSARGEAGRYEHTFRDMVEGVNRLMAVNESSLADLGGVLSALSQGDLTQKITNDYAGTFGRLKDDANATVSQLTGIVGRIQESAELIETASREISQGNADLSQRTEEQASSLEETASLDGGTHRDGQGERGERAASQPARSRCLRRGGQGRRGGGRGGSDDERDISVEEDRRHHRGDRRDRLPDQYSRAQRRGGSRACGRAGARLRGGGERGAQPRAAQCRGGQGGQGRRPHHGRDRHEREAGDGHHSRDHGRFPGTVGRDRAGEHRDHADGRGDAAERGAGGGSGGCRGIHAGAGPGPGRGRGHLPHRRRHRRGPERPPARGVR